MLMVQAEGICYNSTQLNELQRTRTVTPQCAYLNNSTKYKTIYHKPQGYASSDGQYLTTSS